MADAVVVGSGINSLACAALLARGGWSVRVLEREEELGGCIRTAELTEPGYLHDVFSAWHPLWVGGAAHAELGDELAARGLEYLNTDHPTATLFPNGEATFLLRSTEANVAELGPEWAGAVESFFPNADLAFGVLGTELWSRDGLKLGLKAYRRLGRKGAVEFTGNVLASSRDWLRQTFASEGAHGVLAPWVLHTGLGPDAAASGFMTQVIGVAVQEGGMPIPRGGGAKLVEALVRLIEDHGGACETGRDVERVLVRDGKATGVRLADGEERRGGAGGDRERHADPALRPAARRPRGAGPPLPVRALGDADPLRALGAAALGGRRAARPDRDRPPHARPRRRLARGQRGRARPAAGRGDRRRRPAADDRPEPCARRRRAALDPAAGAALAREGRRGRASSTPATARGRRSCASATPTASRHGSPGTCRTSRARS